MASYDEALQMMYSDRLTRFYRNYDEAKVASVPDAPPKVQRQGRAAPRGHGQEVRPRARARG